MDSPTGLQIFFGALTLISALMVVVHRNPVVNAVMLMSTLFCTGALYFGLGFYFIGAVQILIYAGAISVLFVFVIMLLDLRPFFLRIPGRQPKIIAGAVAAFLMVGGLVLSVLPGAAQHAGGASEVQEAVIETATPRIISLDFLSKYMLPYQVTALLILAAVMGVIVLGRPKTPFRTGDRK